MNTGKLLGTLKPKPKPLLPRDASQRLNLEDHDPKRQSRRFATS